MSLPAILLPVFVQVALTFLLGFRMGAARASAVKAGLVDNDHMVYKIRWPEKAQLAGNAFHNQLELPVLFYVVVILALISHKADLLFVTLSWVFVLLRLVHAFVHVTSNELKWRGGSFLLGVLVLMIMWAFFAVRILFL